MRPPAASCNAICNAFPEWQQVANQVAEPSTQVTNARLASCTSGCSSSCRRFLKSDATCCNLKSSCEVDLLCNLLCNLVCSAPGALHSVAIGPHSELPAVAWREKLRRWGSRHAPCHIPASGRVLVLLTVLDAAFQFGSHPTYSSVGTHPMLGGTIKYP